MKTLKTLTIFILILSVSNIYAQPVALDPTFGQNGMTIISDATEVKLIDFDKQGNIIAIGTTKDGNKHYLTIVKTNADGIIDENFGDNGILTLGNNNAGVYDFKITDENKILIVGNFHPSVMMMQFNEDGSFDESFGSSGKIIFHSVLNIFAENIQNSNFLLFSEYNHGYGFDWCIISKYDFSGKKDESFGSSGDVWLTDNNANFNIFPTCIKMLREQSILIAGFDYPAQNHYYNKEPNSKIVFCKLDSNGQFVTDFANNGIFIQDIVFSTESIDEAIIDVLEDSNGNLIFIGLCKNNCFILRVLPNGTIDSTFGEKGFYYFNLQYPFTDIEFTGKRVLLHNNKYLTRWDDRILSINSNGTLDTNFNNNGVFIYKNFTIKDMMLQKAKKIVLGGCYNGKFAITRLNIPNEISIEEITVSSNLPIIYPNPVKDYLYFNNNTQFEIFDIQGRLLVKSEKAMQSVDASHLKAGIYFIRFENKQVEKFVKE